MTKTSIERVREHFEEFEELRREVKALKQLCRVLFCTVSWADGVTQGKKDELLRKMQEMGVDG